MKGMESQIARIKANPSGVKFSELAKICSYYLGSPDTTQAVIMSTTCPDKATHELIFNIAITECRSFIR
ncbi:Uncharacterised protein [Yersinia nurmii]|uniref:Uncharacterized protein n=1 Tax=Yersinia nurmii TaxID=685706 RepID=A0ABM9SMF5_9GAMM|nr:Uncharacterised protein [Yersinia nurmii]